MKEFIISNLGTLAIIVSSIFTFAGVLVTVITKNGKAGNLLKSIGNVVKNLPTLIKRAEQLGGSGEDKKAYVMEQVQLYFRADGVTPSKEDLEDISTQVDEQVKLTKTLHVTATEKATTVTEQVEVSEGKVVSDSIIRIGDGNEKN